MTRPNKPLVFFFFVVLLALGRLFASERTISLHDPRCGFGSTKDDRHPTASKSIGRRIVEQAFNQSYIHLINQCNNSTSLEPRTKDLFTMNQCFAKMNLLATKRKQRGGTGLSSEWPWWFQTMMRDAEKNSELHSSFHLLQFPDPHRLQMCIMPKVGTKNWRRAHCHAITGNATHEHVFVCFRKQKYFPHSQRGVFLRDPLERFLSGFLDKCLSPRRTLEPHCEPLFLARLSCTG